MRIDVQIEIKMIALHLIQESCKSQIGLCNGLKASKEVITFTRWRQEMVRSLQLKLRAIEIRVRVRNIKRVLVNEF